jgi:hypothetical protein
MAEQRFGVPQPGEQIVRKTVAPQSKVGRVDCPAVIDSLDSPRPPAIG